MYFQIIDNNEKCLKMFASGDIVDYKESHQLTRTWKHSKHLANREDVEYAYLYSPDGNIESVCPIFVWDAWKKSSDKISSVMKSIVTAKCNLEDHCIYDYVPPNLMHRYLLDKEVIIKSVFETLDKPEHYDILKKAHILTQEMNSSENMYNGELKNTNYSIFWDKDWSPF